METVSQKSPAFGQKSGHDLRKSQGQQQKPRNKKNPKHGGGAGTGGMGVIVVMVMGMSAIHRSLRGYTWGTDLLSRNNKEGDLPLLVQGISFP